MQKRGKLYHRRALRRGCHNRSLLARQSGSQIVEFLAAIVLLLGFLVIPCLDLAIVPIRWMMAQELINSYVRTLSMCETFTESQHIIDSDPSLKIRLLRLGGVEVESLKLVLKITRVRHEQSEIQSLEVLYPGQIPSAWLPDGSFAPCTYSLDIDAKLTIAPAVVMKWERMPVPGLTEPIPVSLRASHEWMNLGLDPNTGKYFVNE
jgi:hypothetical protein